MARASTLALSCGIARAFDGSVDVTGAGARGTDAVTEGIGSAAIAALSSVTMLAAEIESSRALNALSTPLFGGPSVQRDTVIAETWIVSDQDAIAGAASGAALSAAGNVPPPHDDSSNTVPQCARSRSRTAPVAERDTRSPDSFL